MIKFIIQLSIGNKIKQFRNYYKPTSSAKGFKSHPHQILILIHKSGCHSLGTIIDGAIGGLLGTVDGPLGIIGGSTAGANVRKSLW